MTKEYVILNWVKLEIENPEKTKMDPQSEYQVFKDIKEIVNNYVYNPSSLDLW